MLVSKQTYSPAPGDIAGLKLTSGEEIIAKILAIDEKQVTVSCPLQITATHKGMSLIPILVMSDFDAPVTLQKPLIGIFFNPSPDYKQTYESATTGIALPEKRSLIIK